MLHTGNTLTNFLSLDARYITEHSSLTEVFLGEVVGGQRCGVIRRQGDQVVENTGLACGIPLEGLDTTIRLDSKLGVIVARIHQCSAIVGR